MNALMISIAGMLIPVVAIVMGIGIGMLALVLEHRKRDKIFTLYHQERMAALEKGQELPPLPEEFFYEGKRPSPHAKLLGGLICLFLGAALGIALYFLAGFNIALFALIPFSVGAALLLYYFTVGRKEAEAMEAAYRAKTSSGNRPPGA
jgi:hypothetical protein